MFRKPWQQATFGNETLSVGFALKTTETHEVYGGFKYMAKPAKGRDLHKVSTG